MESIGKSPAPDMHHFTPVKAKKDLTSSEDLCTDRLSFSMSPWFSRSKMPSSSGLKKAFTKILQAGGMSSGNPDDSECVRAFKDVFDRGDAKPGDIILVGNNAKPELSLLDSLVPGDYSHVGIYLGASDKGEHQTLDAWVPGATVRDVLWWPRSYSRWSLLRPVKPDGSELSDDERKKVVDFARSAEGCSYNMNWKENTLVLPVDRDKTSFYCSQLAWASYFHGAGINIDQNPGFSYKYAHGVAPQELHDYTHMKVVEERDFSQGLLTKETLLRSMGGSAGVYAGYNTGSWLFSGMSSASRILGGLSMGLLGAALGVWAGKILYQTLR